jgi:DNA-binding LacI/PurR family transcriptional regulator
VYMARSPGDPACAQVTVLNVDTARQGTDFLLDRGHQRLAYLSGPTNVAASRQRQTGFERALGERPGQHHGATLQPDGINPTDTERVMHSLMQRPGYPTGILTFKTYMALDAIDFLKRAYPERLGEVEFVGFGNLPLLKYLTHKPVASIEENPLQMGQEAMKLLLQLIAEETPTGRQVEVPGELVVYG